MSPMTEPAISAELAAAASPAVAPVTAAERISSLDTLRGVALLGILLMNIVSFGLPGGAYMDPTVAGGASGLNLAAWLINQVWFEGKMRAIFSMLFGAGVVILTARAEERGGAAHVADIYYRRNLWLLLFGLLHAYLIWVGDILYPYALAGLFLYPFRKQSPKFLILAGLLLLATLSPKYYMMGLELRELEQQVRAAEADQKAGKPLTDDQKEAQKNWAEQKKDFKPDPPEVEKEIKDHRGSYATLLARRAKSVVGWQTIFYYHFGFFDVAGMMLLGMGLLKLGVFSATRSYRFYWLLVILGYGIGAPLNCWVGQWRIRSNFDFPGMWTAFSTGDPGRLTVALGHIGLVMLVCKAGLLGWLTRPLAAVGQMALSNYLATSLIATTLFYGHGFGLFGQLQRYQLYLVVLGVWVFNLAASPIWLRHFRFGPFEWLWRSLTYWERQAMRLTGA